MLKFHYTAKLVHGLHAASAESVRLTLIFNFFSILLAELLVIFWTLHIVLSHIYNLNTGNKIHPQHII